MHTKTVALLYAERCRLLECGGVVANCDSLIVAGNQSSSTKAAGGVVQTERSGVGLTPAWRVG